MYKEHNASRLCSNSDTRYRWNGTKFGSGKYDVPMPVEQSVLFAAAEVPVLTSVLACSVVA
jgi:hypothetical protein